MKGKAPSDEVQVLYIGICLTHIGKSSLVLQPTLEKGAKGAPGAANGHQKMQNLFSQEKKRCKIVSVTCC
jgi:hypothetical protein